MFFNPRDVNQRLHNTYCMYDGDLVYITCNGHDFTIKMQSFLTPKKAVSVDISDPKKYAKLDFNTLPVGYVFDEMNARCYYLVRSTVKQYSGGVSSRNLKCNTNGARWLDLFPSGPVEKAILGLYPTFEEAVAHVRNGVERVPISRHYAIGNSAGYHYIYNRDNLIGQVERIHEQPGIRLFDSQFSSVYFNELSNILPDGVMR